MKQSDERMSIQEAAAFLINEKKRMMTSHEIVKEAMERGLLRESRSLNPFNSFVQTLERNIRDQSGKGPKLKFIKKEKKRYIDIVEDLEGDQGETTITKKIPKKNLSVSLVLDEAVDRGIKLYMLANQVSDSNQAINELLKYAIREKHDEIMKEINNFTKTLW